MKMLCTICFLFVFYSSTAATLHVGGTKLYKTVTSAIEAAQPGDTILVDAGTYREKNIVIQKRIVLKGINFPVLDGEKKYQVVSVHADGVIIEGFRIVHSGVSSIKNQRHQSKR